LLERRIELAARVVALRIRLGETARGQPARLDEAKQVMDRLREDFSATDAAQDRRIALLSRQVEDAMRRAERVSWAGSGVAFVLILLAEALVLPERGQRSALEARLREANAALEGRVAERTRALAATRDRLAAFAGGQERAIEAERRRLAREVHDQIGQVFTAIRLIAGSLPRECFPPGQAQALDQALDMGIASTRRVTAALRPPRLDDLGFAVALHHHAEGRAPAAGLDLVVDVADDEGLDETSGLALFRIAPGGADQRRAPCRRADSAPLSAGPADGGAAGAGWLARHAAEGIILASSP
jgi:signal transduction histidine kinase